MQKGWIPIVVGMIAAFVLAVGGTWVFTQTSQASTAEIIHSVTGEMNPHVPQMTQENNAATVQRTAQDSNVTPGKAVARNRTARGYDWKPQGHGFRGGAKGQIDHEALLAEALGITVEELQAAHEAAREAAIQQALDQGLITQEQADQLLNGERNGPRGRGWGHGGPRGKHGPFGAPSNIDKEALLAEALGITVEELQAAHEAAREAGIQQALDEGLITQEEADLMAAHHALKDYLDKEALMAEALGITVEELQAARDEGKSHKELMEDIGLDKETVRQNMQTAHEAAIQQAVADGVITQEQADQILSGEGHGAFGGPRGKGHFRGGKGFGGPCEKGDFNGDGGFRGPRGNGDAFQNRNGIQNDNNFTIPANDA